MLADILDPLVNLATNLIDSIGLVGVFVLMLLESACIPIPSEATMLFAGFAVSDGDMTLVAAVAAGVLGNVLGSWIAWGVGYYGREELLEKNRLIHINPKHLATADRWFREHGEATVFWCRMLPIVRTFISLPAGVAEMPFWRFTLFTFLGCVPWVLGLTLIGRSAGDNWDEWKDKLHYVDYLVAAIIVVTAAWLLIRYLRRRRAGAAAGAGEGS